MCSGYLFTVINTASQLFKSEFNIIFSEVTPSVISIDTVFGGAFPRLWA